MSDVHKSTPAKAVSVVVGPNPVSIGFARRGGSSGWVRGFVANHGGSSVSVVDPGDLVSGKVLTVGVGSGPRQVLASGDGLRMYVANGGDCTVSVIDVPETPPVVASGYGVRTVVVGPNPRAMAVSLSGRWVCVTCEGDSTVAVLDTHTGGQGGRDVVVGRVSVGVCPWQVAADPVVEGRFYVLNYADATVDVVDVAVVDQVVGVRVSATMSVPDTPTGITFSPDGTRAYVTHNTLDEVSVINTVLNTTTTTLPIPDMAEFPLARDMVIHPNGKRLYITTDSLDIVTVTTPSSADKVLHSTVYGREKTLTGLVCHPDGKQLYLTSGSGELEVFDITDIGPDEKPKDVNLISGVGIATKEGRSALEPQHPCVTDNDLLVIPDQKFYQFTLAVGPDTGSLTSSSGATFTHTTGNAPGPHHSAYCPATGLVAITNTGTNSLSLHTPINIHPTVELDPAKTSNPAYTPTTITATTTATLPAKTKPTSISYTDNTLYITDPTTSTIHTYTTTSGTPTAGPDHNCDTSWTPHLLTTTPDGKHLYATSTTNHSIHHFTITADGTLTHHDTFLGCAEELTSISTTAGYQNWMLATTKSGKCLAFALDNDGSIRTYYVPTLPKEISSFAAIACSPADDRDLCAIDASYGCFYELHWDSSKQEISLLSKVDTYWSAIPAPRLPALAVSRDGKYAYAADDSNSVHVIEMPDAWTPRHVSDIPIGPNAYPTALTALSDALVVTLFDSSSKSASVEIINTTGGPLAHILSGQELKSAPPSFTDMKQIGDYVYIQSSSNIYAYHSSDKQVWDFYLLHGGCFRAFTIGNNAQTLWVDYMPNSDNQFCNLGSAKIADINSNNADIAFSSTEHSGGSNAIGQQVIWEQDNPSGGANYVYVSREGKLLHQDDNPVGQISDKYTIKSATLVDERYVIVDSKGAVHIHAAGGNFDSLYDWSVTDVIERVKLNSDLSRTFWAISKTALYLVRVDNKGATTLEKIACQIKDIAQNYGPDTGARFCLMAGNNNLRILQAVTSDRATLPLSAMANSACADSSHAFISSSDHRIAAFKYAIKPLSLTVGGGGFEAGSNFRPGVLCGVGGWVFCVDVDGKLLRALVRTQGGGLVDKGVVVGVGGVGLLVAARVNPKSEKKVRVIVVVDGRERLFTYDAEKLVFSGG
ncbi:YncE family protein, partial [Nocardia brasiliensis]|uniref:YncE family protein n=1 Tax=Nocardia brasiliensis TaxID=37326 RepID=UPI0024589087